MKTIKELEKLAGISEAKKPDEKTLLDLKKKLLTIIKKHGLLKASDFIKTAGKKHGDEYIDPLIQYVKFAESVITDAADVINESDILK